VGTKTGLRDVVVTDYCQLTTDPCCSRKEVIQPHLPVRLPCYDFTPVMNLTVVSALPCRLGNRLLVKPTPMV
jgi:hypothetical protein